MINPNGNSNVGLSLMLTSKEQIKEVLTEIIEEIFGSGKPQDEPQPTWLNSDQVCKRLGISRSTLWKWGRENYLSGHKFGNRVRFALHDVERIECAEK